MKLLRITLTLFSAFGLAAQETPAPDKLTNDHYFELERLTGAQISPDGAKIVYTRQQVNRIEDRWDSSLWMMNAVHRFSRVGRNRPSRQAGFPIRFRTV